jgi:hypothetical protein
MTEHKTLMTQENRAFVERTAWYGRDGRTIGGTTEPT